jgi:Zn-dependent protease
MAILLAHEFGHFIAARIHRVDASLPYFLPLPFLSPFGTMGAVIRMRSAIATRRALLDIGAAGPLCGLALAIPLYAWGVAHSAVIPLPGAGREDGQTIQLGSSLLLSWLDRRFGPPVAEGMDILLSPVAYAAWAGMFVTMINLLPVGQLDGGHVAYAWLGKRQDHITPWVHRSLFAFFFVSLASFVVRDLRTGFGLWHFGRHVNNALFWLVWFEVLAVIGTLSTQSRVGTNEAGQGLSPSSRAVATLGVAVVAGALQNSVSVRLWAAWLSGLALLIAMEVRWGALRRPSGLFEHPPAGGGPLGGVRAAAAALTLGLFALLFMPTPMSP